DREQGEIARSMIYDAAKEFGPIKGVEILTIPTNDSWVRDYGPIFINRRETTMGAPTQIALDWRFNSWGEKYGPCDLDDVVPHRLADRYGFSVVEPGIVMEGGSIEVNGEGTLLTTESCLLNKNRNPNLTREDIEDYLRVFIGVTNVLWLGDGIEGDDTDGHVDDLARFVNRNTILTVIEEDPADANFKPLMENLERLRAMRDQNGRTFKIETMPMPPLVEFEGERLPASYANFLIVNGGVVVPTFEAPSDHVALDTIARLFPGRRVVGVPSVDLVLGLGSVHCLSQQHPAPPTGRRDG
ncbi:MAG TPA: agmatine deiminase family protein, partial [Candidatus Binataceae bacterium]|nr:agmatine deiminase family protein [Candidatus Binataceae bacterium]